MIIGTGVILHRLVGSIDEFLFAVVHDLTGFVPGQQTYAGLAAVVENIDLVIWGIRLLLGVIPMLALLIGTLIFWKFYPLTNKKVQDIQDKLMELGF